MTTYLYFLLKDGIVVYVGFTKDLPSRIKTHKKDKDFDRVRYFETSYYDGSKIERFLIAYLKPKYNIRKDWKRFEVKDFDLNNSSSIKIENMTFTN